jgi:hypothetical protein
MTRRHAAKAATLVALALVCLGCRTCYHLPPGDLMCHVIDVSVVPGSSVAFENPCDTQWKAQDGFKLCYEPRGIYVVTTRRRGITTREIVADEDVPLFHDVPVGFLYSQIDNWGDGAINLTVKAGVVATADPSTIHEGEQTTLTATVAGAEPGFEYSWSPAASVQDSTAAITPASPTVSTTYTVTVSAGGEAVAQDSVRVEVLPVTGGGTADFTWVPDPAVAGQLINLDATPTDSGGDTIVFWQWWWDYAGDPGAEPSATAESPYMELIYETAGTHPTRLLVNVIGGGELSVVKDIDVVAPRPGRAVTTAP